MPGRGEPGSIVPALLPPQLGGDSSVPCVQARPGGILPHAGAGSLSKRLAAVTSLCPPTDPSRGHREAKPTWVTQRASDRSPHAQQAPVEDSPGHTLFALETTASLCSLFILERPKWSPLLSPPQLHVGAGTAPCGDCALPSLIPASAACHFVLGAEVTDVSAARLLSGLPDCCVQPPA